MTATVLDPYDDLPKMQPGDIASRIEEPDRIAIHANGIVIDVVSNDDRSVYVEIYAYEGQKYQAVVEHAFIDAYKYVHPSLRLGLADKPK